MIKISFLVILQCSFLVFVFAYTNYDQAPSDSGDSMESYLESNAYYGRKYPYDYSEPGKVKYPGILANSNPPPAIKDVKDPSDRKINSVDVDDEELMETGDVATENDVDFQDSGSSEEIEVMIVGENETPRAELLKRAKRYLSQINLAAYTPASPFYSYYNPGVSTSSGNSDSDRETTASSINSRTMESLLASCQLTNLLLYRAVNQKASNTLMDPAADYARTVQHVPLAIGTFGALLEGNLGQRWPTLPYSPVQATKAISQPMQTYITTRTFLTTMTSTEVLRQGATLSTHLRVYAFKTSHVHTLFFTKELTATPVVYNPKPTATVIVTPSFVVPKVRVDDEIGKILGENRQNRSSVDTNRQKRKNPEDVEEILESSEEQFDKDDEYAAYQYGAYRCPPMETETKTKTATRTVTVVTTVTKYINPSPTYVSASSLRTLRQTYSSSANKRQKSFEPTGRRIPFRPVGRLFTYTRPS